MKNDNIKKSLQLWLKLNIYFESAYKIIMSLIIKVVSMGVAKNFLEWGKRLKQIVYNSPTYLIIKLN